jgi:hypothetical protein
MEVNVIDWYSFTAPISVVVIISAEEGRRAADALIRNYEELAGLKAFGKVLNFPHGQNRAPYRYCFQSPEVGLFIHCGPGREEVLFEITGRGCGRLDGSGHLLSLIIATHLRATRIDVALDIINEIDPELVVAAGYSKRFTSGGTQRSKTGVTCYVGSMRSDLMARVYRYAPPHPRAAALRVEHVFRRNRAKGLAGAIADGLTVEGALNSAMSSFGWEHPLLLDAVSKGGPLPTLPSAKAQSNRVWWLFQQVAPAVATALHDGSLDWDKWVDEIDKHIPEGIARQGAYEKRSID